MREHKGALTKPSRFSNVAEHFKNSGQNIHWFDMQIIIIGNITIESFIQETWLLDF